MKGIFVLSFHKQPGAFVDREYPAGITAKLGIDSIEQNKIYSLHRMRNTRPNFLFVKVKGHHVASFYSGFDSRQFVGRPNHCISIILDEGENPTKWEGQLRRLTYDLLPVLDEIRGGEMVKEGLDPDPKYKPFDELLAQKFEALKRGEIEPMEEGEGEYIEGEGAVIEKISSDHVRKTLADDQLHEEDIIKATELAKQQLLSEAAGSGNASSASSAENEMDSIISQATKEMEKIEVDALREEVRSLHELIAQKDDQIRSLEAQLQELRTAKSESLDAESSINLDRIKGEYEALLASKESELERWRTKVSELNEEIFIQQDNLRKTTEMMMQMTMEAQQQAERMRELKMKIKQLEANVSAPTTANEQELSMMRSHLTELEEELKVKDDELEKSKERNKKMFMELKKKDEEIAELQARLNAMKDSQNELEAKDNEIARLKDKVKALEEELVEAKRKIKLLRRDLKSAQSGAAPSTAAESDSAGDESYRKLLEENKKLKKSLMELQLKIDLLQQKPVMVEGGADRKLTEKINEQKRRIDDLEKELIKAKKTIIVQEREINHLKELLDLG